MFIWCFLSIFLFNFFIYMYMTLNKDVICIFFKIFMIIILLL